MPITSASTAFNAEMRSRPQHDSEEIDERSPNEKDERKGKNIARCRDTRKTMRCSKLDVSRCTNVEY